MESETIHMLLPDMTVPKRAFLNPQDQETFELLELLPLMHQAVAFHGIGRGTAEVLLEDLNDPITIIERSEALAPESYFYHRPDRILTVTTLLQSAISKKIVSPKDTFFRMIVLLSQRVIDNTLDREQDLDIRMAEFRDRHQQAA